MSNDLESIKPGDYLVVNGRPAIAIHQPQVVVLYESLGIEVVPMRAVERSSSRPDIKTEDLMRARERWPEVKP